MFRKTLIAFGFFASLSLVGCVGPLVLHETARTVGDSNHEWTGGYGNGGYVVKYTYGVTDDFDFGAQMEATSLGLRLKYAFLNEKQGLSVAGALGIGASIGGSHTYGDLIASYGVESWEPYATFRYVQVDIDPGVVRDANTNEAIFTTPAFDFNYGQIMIGSRYWFDERLFLSAEFSTLFSTVANVKFNSNLIASGALGYRF